MYYNNHDKSFINFNNHDAISLHLATWISQVNYMILQFFEFIAGSLIN